VSASSRTGAKVLACGTALFAAAFAAGVAVRRDNAHVASPVAAIRPAVPVAGLGPAMALPVLRHRIVPTFNAEASGKDENAIVQQVLAEIVRASKRAA